jgi:methionyl-tRNA formyltransferase
MKVGVIGSVGTTLITMEELIRHNFEVVGVLGFQPENTKVVSGWVDLKSFSETQGIEYMGFNKINDAKYIEWMRNKEPEIIFAVGFSQLLSREWLNLSKKGCIGFHPTSLPEGRGRAPIAWMILEKRNGAATFFQIGEGVDDGPIHVQVPYQVEEDDDAETLVPKVHSAIRIALEQWLPKLKNGYWNPQEQDHSKASYYGKREPADGLINWLDRADEIDRLVKASCRPHPGAFTFVDVDVLKIWKSSVIKDSKIKGVPGRVVDIKDGQILVQCGVDHLLIKEFSYNGKKKISVGTSFESRFCGTFYELNNKILEI